MQEPTVENNHTTEKKFERSIWKVCGIVALIIAVLWILKETFNVLLLVLAMLHGEYRTFSFSRITSASIVAWLYLTCAGSLIGFTAYVWLLHVSTPARVSTYAYVNPLIAVLLGCTIGGETASPRLFAAGALIVLAVGLIVSSPSGTNAKPKRDVEAVGEVPMKTTQP